MSSIRPLTYATRIAPAALAASLLACVLACGCGATRTTQPGGHALVGHVTLTIPITDAAGDTTGFVADSTATGITVRLLDDRGMVDSAATVNGTFRLPAARSTYRLVAGPTLATADTLGPFGHSVTAPAVALHPRGAITLMRSRFIAGTETVTIQFGALQDEHVLLRVRALDGTVIATLVDGMLAGGVYQYVWNGQTDAAANASPGTYWITCEGVPGGAPRSSLRPADIGPVLPPADSRGARAAVIVTP